MISPLNCSKIIELAKLDLSDQAHMDVMSLLGNLTIDPWCNAMLIVTRHHDSSSFEKLVSYMFKSMEKEKIAETFTLLCCIKASPFGEMVSTMDPILRAKIVSLLHEEVSGDKKQEILNNSPQLKSLLFREDLTEEVLPLKNKKPFSKPPTSKKM